MISLLLCYTLYIMVDLGWEENKFILKGATVCHQIVDHFEKPNDIFLSKETISFY